MNAIYKQLADLNNQGVNESLNISRMSRPEIDVGSPKEKIEIDQCKLQQIEALFEFYDERVRTLQYLD